MGCDMKLKVVTRGITSVIGVWKDTTIHTVKVVAASLHEEKSVENDEARNSEGKLLADCTTVEDCGLSDNENLFLNPPAGVGG